MTKGRVVISINSSWNIVNFRSGLIEALRNAGYEIVALAPEDGHSPRFEQLGVRFVPIAMDGQGVSPAADLALLLRYRSALKRIRPDAFSATRPSPISTARSPPSRSASAVINNVSGLGTAFIRSGMLTRIVSRPLPPRFPALAIGLLPESRGSRSVRREADRRARAGASAAGIGDRPRPASRRRQARRRGRSPSCLSPGCSGTRASREYVEAARHGPRRRIRTRGSGCSASSMSPTAPRSAAPKSRPGSSEGRDRLSRRSRRRPARTSPRPTASSSLPIAKACRAPCSKARRWPSR